METDIIIVYLTLENHIKRHSHRKKRRLFHSVVYFKVKYFNYLQKLKKKEKRQWGNYRNLYSAWSIKRLVDFTETREIRFRRKQKHSFDFNLEAICHGCDARSLRYMLVLFSAWLLIGRQSSYPFLSGQ